MPPSARLADPRDAEAVAELMVGFRDYLGYTRPSDNALLANVELRLEERDADFLLGFADADSPPCGVVSLRFRGGIWGPGQDCLIEDVFVAERARGSGLGRTMMQLALARARERGAWRVELDTNEANAAAIALYESLGFYNANASYGGARDLYFRMHLDDE